MLELGVCYYPEQWDEGVWAQDAQRMVELGLKWVRIGEFSWAHVEPRPGELRFDWLDRAVDTLGSAGLKVILGTPTAAPPKWLVDKYPSILPVGEDGHVRRFGARRHYCFSSREYRREAARIATAFAERYGKHPYVQAWQIDNEYGDHDTIHSYSAEATRAFRIWLQSRYGAIAELNAAWGTSFWSMHYNDFEEVELPNQLVEEPSPTHLVDFLRFSSDQVISFNRMQAEIIRANAPGRAITHNFMSHNTDFDHHALGADIDIASWDSYPMGGLLNGRLSADEKEYYLRMGDPDQPSFNHDLYRGVGRGNVWVMEMQPGPVNWAAHNQSPEDGMIRLWTWLAYAHGVDMVAYFRWRQAPFAQEQFHAGLLLPDSTPDQAFAEVAKVVSEIGRLPDPGPRAKAQVALVLDYPSRWAARALPQGASYSSARIALDWYSTMSRLGVDIDIIGPNAELDHYALVLVPDMLIADTAFIARLQACSAKSVFGPRSGSKSQHMHIPATLPPGPIAKLINLRVTRVESLPASHTEPVLYGNEIWYGGTWRETIETEATPLARFDGSYRNGSPAIVGNEKARYLAILPDVAFLERILSDALDWAGVAYTADLGDIRITRRGNLGFAFNFGPQTSELSLPETTQFHVGGHRLEPAGVAIWSLADTDMLH